MTGLYGSHLPYEFLGLVSNRIINEIDGISRVVYDALIGVSGKHPVTSHKIMAGLYWVTFTLRILRSCI